MAYIHQFNLFIEEESFEEDESLMDFDDEIQALYEAFLRREGIRGEWISSRSKTILTENFGRCRLCGCPTSDKTQEHAVEEVSNGAIVDGDWLCDTCLPPDHPNAF